MVWHKRLLADVRRPVTTRGGAGPPSVFDVDLETRNRACLDEVWINRGLDHAGPHDARVPGVLPCDAHHALLERVGAEAVTSRALACPRGSRQAGVCLLFSSTWPR